ncbi:MAG: hypothetical protein ACFFDT_07770 [Candidatus Hodarchaeota archaeon]
MPRGMTLQLPETSGGHVVTTAEGTAGYAELSLTDLIIHSNSFLKSLHARIIDTNGECHSGCLFLFGIDNHGAIDWINSDHQGADQPVTWQGNLPIPSASIIKIRCYGVTATDIIYASGLIYG